MAFNKITDSVGGYTHEHVLSARWHTMNCWRYCRRQIECDFWQKQDNGWLTTSKGDWIEWQIRKARIEYQQHTTSRWEPIWIRGYHEPDVMQVDRGTWSRTYPWGHEWTPWISQLEAGLAHRTIAHFFMSLMTRANTANPSARGWAGTQNDHILLQKYENVQF